MPEHYDIEITCESCGETTLLNPPIGNKEYSDFCEYCSNAIKVPEDHE